MAQHQDFQEVQVKGRRRMVATSLSRKCCSFGQGLRVCDTNQALKDNQHDARAHVRKICQTQFFCTRRRKRVASCSGVQGLQSCQGVTLTGDMHLHAAIELHKRDSFNESGMPKNDGDFFKSAVDAASGYTQKSIKQQQHHELLDATRAM